MRRALRAWLIEISADEISDVVLAVDEAVSNAIEHAGLTTDGSITVQAGVVDTTLRVEIRDHGTWREPTPSETRGRGLLIMKRVMDEVSIEHRLDDTRVILSRRVR
jgi:serine/threonine-protein kinase RsbW